MSLMAIVASTTFSMQAANYTFASNSKLANGKWVKIAIPEDGVYQLTFDELAEMGFSNPQSVRIYGNGGYRLSEILDGSQTDDLQQIPIKIFDNKICFYGCGPVKFTLATPTNTPHYTRMFNCYSTKGYYFITENIGSQKEIEQVTRNNTGSVVRNRSLDYMLHERELISPKQTGKEFLGETMTNGEITIPYSLPDLCGDATVVVNSCAAAKVSASCYVKAELNDNDLNYPLGSSKIYPPANSEVGYNFASPYKAFEPQSGSTIPQNGNIKVSLLNPNGTINSAWLDYIIITYYHNNTLENAADNQLRMGFNKVTSSDAITLNTTNRDIQVWNINNPNAPKSYTLTSVGMTLQFTPGTATNWGQYIAFDPTKELKSIAEYSLVENQNIHNLPNPNMVIVTCKELLPQAERVAQMHRDNDNMTVHVLDQEKIFNEFSSGTPDAMAIRLMSKMFYDRNSYKFKNLLMFGAGKYDNRQILSKYPCTILTYESDNSNDEQYSYVCDDFFGLLDDNSGSNPAADYLRLGVGRMPCASVSEAEDDVDKLLNYVNNPDFGPWRNDLQLTADDYDNGLHAFQTEGIANILNDELKTGMAQNKVYISQFPNETIGGDEFAFEARKELIAQLTNGQYFMTYVGHGDKNYLTKDVQLWTAYQSNTVEYPHLPILTTACCDVARYDSNQRGLVEVMFHKKNGGAIAMVTSARSVLADNNDALNQAFVRAMFCYKDKGYMPTVGEAYMLCKQSFGNTENTNKMSFMLLGDPAMKVNYPKPFFKIESINGTAVNDSEINSGAMQEVTVVAKVYNADGAAVNTNFNGDATLSIYDKKKKETTITARVNREDVSRDIYYPRDLLTRVSGRVVDGVFTGTAVIPRNITANGENGLVTVYAHMDDSEEMVNGTFDKLKLEVYNPENPLTVNDNQPPVIEKLYFNDEQEFADGALIPASSTLYIKASDDYAFNTQSMAIGNSMSLQLDGGKTTYPLIKNYSALSDNGKTLAIEFPMDLSEGRHTLQYTVYDAAGNMATESISFLVGNDSQLTLTVDEEPAVEEATFNITTNLTTAPEVAIKVVDPVGNIIWNTTTSTFPFTWDLTDNSGNRVPAGIYKFYGTYKSDNAYGGTEIKHLIIIEPYKQSTGM